MNILSLITGLAGQQILQLWLPCVLFGLFIFSINNINIGVALLIFAIAVSPEMTGIFGPDVPIRADDILIIMLFLVWLMKIGRGELGIYRTPLTAPIIVFVIMMMISTAIGYSHKGTIVNIKYSLLVILKNCEYYMAFFLVANTVHTRKDVRRILFLWMAAYLFVVLYGIGEHVLMKAPGRLYDEGPWYLAQSNHMGGFLTISTMIALALFLSARTIKSKAALFILICLSLYPFLYNQSKESYLAFSFSLTTLFLIFKPRLLFIPVVFILILFIAIPYLFPNFGPVESLEITRDDSFRMDINRLVPSSADVRRRTIVRSVQMLGDNPFIGCGAGYKGLSWYDSQIPLLLLEYGLIGTALFLWLMFSVFINGFRIFLHCRGAYFRGIAAAFIASFIGVLVFSVPSPAWMVTLIAGPFWFFAGLVVAINRINMREIRESANGL